MTDKQKDDLLKDADAVIGVIKAQHEKELIKYYDIVPMKDKNTGKDLGSGVQMDLNPSYAYAASTLTDWKQLLKADDWAIYLTSWGYLYVTFLVRYKED